MKYIKTLAVILFAASMLQSCNYLEKEPDTELTLDMVFANRDKVYEWLAYAYSGIPNPGSEWLNSHGWEVFADDLTPSAAWAQWEWGNIYKILGSWTPNTNWDGGYWHRMPRYIRQCYILMENIHALPDQNLSQSEVDMMKAECRFLVAYYYWLMTSVYGPIPFKPNYITPTEFDLSDLMIGQTPFDDIVDWIDRELQEVAELLPAIQVDNRYGRATSIMCHTIRSKMLLFAASPLVNGNSWYVGHTNSDGVELFNTTYDHNKWVKAAEACKEAISAAEAAGHKLFTVASTVQPNTHDPFLSLENMWWTTYQSGNTEILFPYTKSSDTYANYKFYSNKIQTLEFNGGGGLGVYQGLVDAFFTQNGLPIDDPDSGYVESGFTTAAATRATSWTGGNGTPGVVTQAGIYNMYANREPRFYTSVSFHGSWFALAGRPYNFFYTGGGLGNTSDNYHDWDAPMNGYLARKKNYPMDNNKTGSWQPRQVFLYRLAATYLDYAEAVNEAYDNTASRQEALDYMNKVRFRAGVRQYTFAAVPANDPDYIQAQDNQDAVRELVRMERRVELCCEGSRWFDIRRWMIAHELPEVTGQSFGMNRLGTNATAFFNRTSHQTRVWKNAYYWMPVYIAEYEKNPNLVQAPFWN